MSSKQPRPVAKSVFWKKRPEWTKQISELRYVSVGTLAWAEFEGKAERVRVFYDPRFLNLPFLSRWSVYMPREKRVTIVVTESPVPPDAIHLSSADSPHSPHDYTAPGEIPEECPKDFGRSPALRPVRSLFPPFLMGDRAVRA